MGTFLHNFRDFFQQFIEDDVGHVKKFAHGRHAVFQVNRDPIALTRSNILIDEVMILFVPGMLQLGHDLDFKKKLYPHSLKTNSILDGPMADPAPGIMDGNVVFPVLGLQSLNRFR